MLRQRNTKKDPLNIVRNLDAFPKIPDEYKVGTPIGGVLSILSRLIIVFLVYKEIQWYNDSQLVFRFKPDVSMDQRLKIHVDITVASPCRSIGADNLDSTSQLSFGILAEDDTWWDLCPKQREHFDYIQSMNAYLREEWHSLTQIIFKSITDNPGDHRTTAYNLPARSDNRDRSKTPYDACRIHGELTLNKVAGNLHIIGGKQMQMPHGHVHMSFDAEPRNFSHRINRFSFGDSTLALVHPLEGDERVLHDENDMMQYFIEVVPTEIRSLFRTWHTYQYSVRENVRPLDDGASNPKSRIPGLYFKYDMAALAVIAEPNREHLLTFFVRLASIISGIVVISGALNTVSQAAVRAMCKPTADATQNNAGTIAAPPPNKNNGASQQTGGGGGSNVGVRSNLLLNAQLPDGYAYELSTPKHNESSTVI